ncbi:hypothetical protein [Ramlibacter sp.]|uniref:hypothetical protein n=1 Tax=Ramlibacter sp. TaxID=1917967 RepID=UPI003D129E6A
MYARQFSTVAEQAIDGFDSTARTAIGAWREGGERFGAFARERWDAALQQSSGHLAAETKRNANHARDVFGDLYTRGVALTAGGAEAAVDTVVNAARGALERAAAWRQSRA